jgi:preprotein translocase subunit SecD
MKPWLCCLLCAALLLAGCDRVLGNAKTIRLTASAPLAEADMKILTARLKDHISSDYPNLRAETSGATATISARGLPDNATIQTLLAHRGIFELKSQDGEVGFTQRDIAESLTGFDPGGQAVLRLRLTQPGSRAFADFSGRKKGQLVTASLDGELLSTLKVPGRIESERLQLVVGKTAAELSLLTTILKYGALGEAKLTVAVQ